MLQNATHFEACGLTLSHSHPAKHALADVVSRTLRSSANDDPLMFDPSQDEGTVEFK